MSKLLPVYVAIVVGAAFILCHLKPKQWPDLGQFVAVFLASAAAVQGAKFGIEALTVTTPWAVAADDRTPFVLGAVAIEWITLSQIGKAFYRVLKGP